MVEGNKANTTQSDPVGGAPVFTLVQHAEILKLLGTSNVQTDSGPIVNMAGTALQADSLDWIIDT